MTSPLSILRRTGALIALLAGVPTLSAQSGPVSVEIPASTPPPQIPQAPDAIVTPGDDPESDAINRAEQQKAQMRLETYQAERAVQVRSAEERRRAYEAAVTAYETDTARVNRENAARKAQWEADTAACLAGDRTRCVPGPQ